jgi:hypothetical protein
LSVSRASSTDKGFCGWFLSNFFIVVLSFVDFNTDSSLSVADRVCGAAVRRSR